jgi:predicted nuclease with TOPRIM domain
MRDTHHLEHPRFRPLRKETVRWVAKLEQLLAYFEEGDLATEDSGDERFGRGADVAAKDSDVAKELAAYERSLEIAARTAPTLEALVHWDVDAWKNFFDAIDRHQNPILEIVTGSEATEEDLEKAVERAEDESSRLDRARRRYHSRWLRERIRWMEEIDELESSYESSSMGDLGRFGVEVLG